MTNRHLWMMYVNVAAHLKASPGTRRGLRHDGAGGRADISTTRRRRRVVLLVPGSRRSGQARGDNEVYHYLRRADGRCGKQKGSP